MGQTLSDQPKTPCQRRLPSSSGGESFLPAAAVNLSISLSGFSPVPLTAAPDMRFVCVFFLHLRLPFSSHHLQSGRSPAALPCDRQAGLGRDRFYRNRKHFIAGVATPPPRPHESGRAHRRATRERFRSHQQGVEGCWRW